MSLPTQHNVHLARQPILDRRQALVAFELLFRAGTDVFARFTDARAATAEVILGAFFDLGIERVLGRHRGFVNVDAEMLLCDAVLLLPKDKVVLELLETIRIDGAVLGRVEELSRLGYTIALDDVVTIEQVGALLPLADIVKIDVLATPASELGALVERFRRQAARPGRGPVSLLAEKVETREQMRACHALGFDLFQGYHFARPELLSGQRLDRSKLALCRLLVLAQREAETEEIEAEVRHHPHVVYDLMRLANSASLGLAEKADSLRRAIVVLGQRQIRRWVQLLVYSAGGADAAARAPGTSPLMHLAATRARLMERLAEVRAPLDRRLHEQAFMTGVLSLLDALLGVTLAEVVEAIEPPPEIRAALLRREGLLGRLLDLVERAEENDRGSERAALLRDAAISESEMLLAELEALRWAAEIENAA